MDLPLPSLPARDPKGHKGTFGIVAVVGGCCVGESRMIGAPALAATAALRAGAGLARLVMPAPILDAGITIAPSATGIALPTGADGAIFIQDGVATIDRLARTCQCLAIGPGLGEGEPVRALALRAIQQEDAPVIVDADAINALAGIPELFRDFHAAAILTPHPGEFRRLAAALKIRHDPVVDASRPAAAEELAQRLGCIVILKGAGTVVSDGHRTWTCARGHPCMATAGTGDVLTGVVAGLVAQFVAVGPAKQPGRPLDLFDTARLAVEAHARAGELWAARRPADAGLLASELADLIPEALDQLRSS